MVVSRVESPWEAVAVQQAAVASQAYAKQQEAMLLHQQATRVAAAQQQVAAQQAAVAQQALQARNAAAQAAVQAGAQAASAQLVAAQHQAVAEQAIAAQRVASGQPLPAPYSSVDPYAYYRYPAQVAAAVAPPVQVYGAWPFALPLTLAATSPYFPAGSVPPPPLSSTPPPLYGTPYTPPTYPTTAGDMMYAARDQAVQAERALLESCRRLLDQR